MATRKRSAAPKTGNRADTPDILPRPGFHFTGQVGMGKGGQLTLGADGKPAASGRLERTVPVQFSIGEGSDIGMDGGSPVDFSYSLPFAFTRRIDHVEIDL